MFLGTEFRIVEAAQQKPVAVHRRPEPFKLAIARALQLGPHPRYVTFMPAVELNRIRLESGNRSAFRDLRHDASQRMLIHQVVHPPIRIFFTASDAMFTPTSRTPCAISRPAFIPNPRAFLLLCLFRTTGRTRIPSECSPCERR